MMLITVLIKWVIYTIRLLDYAWHTGFLDFEIYLICYAGFLDFHKISVGFQVALWHSDFTWISRVGVQDFCLVVDPSCTCFPVFFRTVGDESLGEVWGRG